MRNVVRLIVVVSSLICGTMVSAAPLHCGVTAQQVRVQQQALVAVPVAVAVAQPVAVLQYPQVWYGAGVRVQQTVHEQVSQDIPVAEPGEPWIRRVCLACHNVSKAEGGIDLSDLATLSTEKRLRAIQRVVSDDPAVRMPPSVELEPAALGGLVQELSEFKGEAK